MITSHYLRYPYPVRALHRKVPRSANNSAGRFHSVVLRLDYLSCVLTVMSTVLIGRRNWEGWVLAGVNSVIICVIGFRTSQLGFIPANLFCIVLYGFNLHSWRKSDTPS